MDKRTDTNTGVMRAVTGVPRRRSAKTFKHKAKCDLAQQAVSHVRCEGIRGTSGLLLRYLMLDVEVSDQTIKL